MRIYPPAHLHDFSSRICTFSCLFLPLKLPRVPGSLALHLTLLSFHIIWLLSTTNLSFLSHSHTETDPEIFTPEPPNEDKNVSTRNALKGRRKANHLFAKAKHLVGDQGVTCF